MIGSQLCIRTRCPPRGSHRYWRHCPRRLCGTLRGRLSGSPGIITSCDYVQINVSLTAHLVGEGGHGDSLPGASDQGGGAGREVTRVQSAPGHVSQEHRLQSHAVR